ncbi:Sua5/YciO/YrdC/YwlC family protein [Alphaproteobacteria bacterium]|nr:Sua5/YciO/YrdC/YwlC family protein [Alphaproteobacteria bacterium]
MNKKEQIKIKADNVPVQSSQVLDVIEKGGVAIIPLDVAYAIVGNSKRSIENIFSCKDRSYEKPSGMFSNYDLLKEIQIIESWKHDIIKAVIFDNDLPMSTVAPFKKEHPIFKNLDPWVLNTSSKIGTLDMLLNAGEFHNEMTKQSMDRLMPVLGSSANTSLTGSKYILDEVDSPVLKAGDILVDGGKSKYANDDGLSSSIIDFSNFQTIRVGVCYEKICEIFLKFNVDLKRISSA